MANEKFTNGDLKDILDEGMSLYAHQGFVENDPIGIPHQYETLQDVEITAFITAILAWGNRKTIVNKATELFAMMDNDPYNFVTGYGEDDLEPLKSFKHRTFKWEDLEYFLRFFKDYYATHTSLQTVFLANQSHAEWNAERSLIHFHDTFFALGGPQRTRKHIATPAKKSTCKRINMFLRWMVRKPTNGIDFGLWNGIPQSELMVPYDVHVERVAKALGLVTRKSRDWPAVVELTENLKQYDPNDPTKYDFALFSIGANKMI